MNDQLLATKAIELSRLTAEGALSIRPATGEGRYFTSHVELCRCGGSRNKPFCDGTHEAIGFRSDEPSSRLSR